MGADVFMITATGVSARDAFTNARQEALHYSGHGGYTGTIAEKDSFNVITLKEGLEPHKYADELIDNRDPRIDNKWGPAGCFDLGGGRYLFFGWASC
jgi:hypothetical protein